MRAVWVDAGTDADYTKLRGYAITSPYYACTDPRVTRAYLDGVRAAGFHPGIYAAWNWQPNLDGTEFAEWLSSELARITEGTNTPDHPRVCIDIETHDIAYIIAFLHRWRRLRPHKTTDWTLEPFQGGLFGPVSVSAIHQAEVGIVPQHYTGSMEPVAADRVVLDLVRAGFYSTRLWGFYDGAHLPRRWEGYIFTEGRLP